MTFTISTFQFHWKSEHNQVKWNKITQDKHKPDSIFFIYKAATCLNDFWNLFLDKVCIIKGNWIHLAQKNSQPGSKNNQYLGYHKNV